MNPKITSIEDILSPIGINDFFNLHWSKNLVHIVDNETKFENLISWGFVNEILSKYRVDYPRIRLIKNGEILPPHQYIKYIKSLSGDSIPIIESKKLTNELQNGAVLSINSVEQFSEQLTNLKKLFISQFHAHVSINLYAGWNSSIGFDLHSDSHDVFILQISGKKKWIIYDIFETKIEIEIKQGDLIYLPKGWRHSTETNAAPSLHLTIGVTNINGESFLSWICKELYKMELFQMDIPLFDIYKTKKHLLTLENQMSKYLSINNLDNYTRYLENLSSQDEKFNLPQL